MTPADIAARLREARRPAQALWHSRPWGSVLRVALAVLSVPTFLNLLLGEHRPAGVLVNGAVVGALYGLIAVGVILVYRANRIVNFAQAGLGAVPAVAALLLITDHDWPYFAAIPVLVGGALLLGAVVEMAFIRRFAKAPRLILSVVTIGVAQLLAYVEFHTPLWLTGDTIPPTEFPTPFSAFRFRMGNTHFKGDHLVTVLLVGALVVGLGLFFRLTRVGIGVRAAAENDERASLLGVPVRRLSTLVWMLAALLSAIGMFLRAPLVGLPMGTIIGPTILLYALAAAMVARMESLPVAFGAGMAIGALNAGMFYTTQSTVLGEAMLLPIILVALLVQRTRISRAEDTGVTTWRTVKEFRPIPAELRQVREVVWVRRAFAAVVALLAVFGPVLVGELYYNDAALVIVYAVIGVSLVVLTGWAGQISLGQFAFVGVGAAVAGGLAGDAGWDFFGALLVAGLVGAALAVVVGVPALRLPGLFLAVTTLAFAGAVRAFVLDRDYFGWLLPELNNVVYRPRLYGKFDTGNDLLFYYVCLAILVLFVVMARQLRNSRSGRVMIAVRTNARAAQAYGVNLPRTKLAAFAMSGFMAAVAGGLLAYQQGAVDSGTYGAVESIKVFAMAVVGGLTSLAGAIAGAVYLVGFLRLPGLRDIQLIDLLATGVGLMILLLFFPGGLAEIGFRMRDAFLRWVADRRGIHVPSLVADALEAQGEPVTGEEPDEVVAPAAASVARRARRSRARVRAVAEEGELEVVS
ncbi:MAG TPA: ABC transporter permease [Acidimicrobiales bacterium]|nr:ABC transporter permease [Acidimicrobiales bacterium]